VKTDKLQQLMIAAEVARNTYLDLVLEIKTVAYAAADTAEEAPRNSEGAMTPDMAELWDQANTVLDLTDWELDKCHGFYTLIVSEMFGRLYSADEDAISHEIHNY
jgi:hypothetical protein